MTELDQDDGWAGGAEALSEANVRLTNKPIPKDKSWDEQMDDHQPSKQRKEWYER